MPDVASISAPMSLSQIDEIKRAIDTLQVYSQAMQTLAKHGLWHDGLPLPAQLTFAKLALEQLKKQKPKVNKSDKKA